MRTHYPLILLLLLLIPHAAVHGQDEAALEARVEQIFSESCAMAGCHSGPVAMLGLDLTAQVYRHSTLGVASTERPDLQIIHPGSPDSSYLVKKVRGDEDIVGLPMPFSGERLNSEEIEAIEQWVAQLDPDAASILEPVQAEVHPFPGWKIINLPTSRGLPQRTLLFLISHRFVPEVTSGYETFFGLDGGGIINMSLGYALTNRLLFAVARSSERDNVEAQLRYHVLRQGGAAGLPLGLSVQGSMNWLTEDRDAIREPVKFALQASATRQMLADLSLAIVPGLLTNPAEEVEGEAILVTLGIGGRWNFHRTMSLVGEWTPMLSGFTRTRTAGLPNRYDNFGAGLEIATAGHVFQIVLTNALGLATDQYLRGGDLDVRSGEVRLGFNIFRMINL